MILDREKGTFSLWMMPTETGRLTIPNPTGPLSQQGKDASSNQQERANKNSLSRNILKYSLSTYTDLKFASVSCQMIGFTLKILLTNLRIEPEAHPGTREEKSDWQLSSLGSMSPQTDLPGSCTRSFPLFFVVHVIPRSV